MNTLTVEELRQIDKASIPELRRIWDSGRRECSGLAYNRLVMLDQIGPDHKPYVFGTIINRFVLGDITIIVTKVDHAYHGYAPDGEYRRIEPEEVADKRSYHYYIGDRDTGHSAPTLDRALLEALCWKYESQAQPEEKKSDAWNRAANSRAVNYVARMIGMDS